MITLVERGVLGLIASLLMFFHQKIKLDTTWTSQCLPIRLFQFTYRDPSYIMALAHNSHYNGVSKAATCASSVWLFEENHTNSLKRN